MVETLAEYGPRSITANNTLNMFAVKGDSFLVKLKIKMVYRYFLSNRCPIKSCRKYCYGVSYEICVQSQISYVTERQGFTHN